MDAQKLIETLILAEHARSYRRDEPLYKPVVTISRDLGAGGGEIAQRLSAILKVPIYDKQILDEVADRSKVDPKLMASLDESGAQLHDAWAFALFSGQSAHLTHYRHHLVNVVLRLAKSGGVIIGRGAHVILHTREAFRLRLVGSLEQCAQRVAAREGTDLDAARARVERVNAERNAALVSLFKHPLDEAKLFDLVVNTDRIKEWDAAVRLILEAMRSMGFRIAQR